MTAPARRPARHANGLPDEDRRAAVAALSRQAVVQAGSLVTGDDWAAWLSLAARLPGWSFTNLMLITAQRPAATMVAGYEEWQALGRHVCKGEPGIKVIAEPRASAAVPDDAGRPSGPEPSEHLIRDGRQARVAHVWDITQTSGPATTARGIPPLFTEGSPLGLREALTWLARREGFAVDLRDCGPIPGATNWGSRRIQIRPGLDAAEEAWALIHEVGHVLAHGSLAVVPDASTAGCRGIRKIEADSIAFIVSARLGHQAASRTWPHVASWAGSDARARPQATIHAAGTRITSAAAAITAHLDTALFARPQVGSATRLTAEPDAAKGIDPGEQRISGARMIHDPVGAHASGGDPTTAGPPDCEVVRVLLDAERFYLSRLNGSWVPGYLESRGFSRAAMTRWRASYAPAGWTVLVDHLRARGHDDAAIEASGLARRSSRGTLIDHFRDRVMLPIRDEDGVLTGFIGRAHPDAGPAVPKYLNSPQTALYTKGDLLFGLHEARTGLTRGAVPVIAEGPFDAIAISLASPERYAGLAPCGTALTSRQAAALARAANLSKTGVLVALDGDRAGREAAVRAYRILLPVTDRLAAVIVPPDRDPAQILRTDGPAALGSLLEHQVQPLARVVIDAHLDSWATQLDHPEGQLRAMRSAAAIIAGLLPSDLADRILRITGGRIIATLDENLHPLADARLPVIARMLPAGAACQIAGIADRMNTDYSDITAEVVNAITGGAADWRGTVARDPPNPSMDDQIGRPDATSGRLTSRSFPDGVSVSQKSTTGMPARLHTARFAAGSAPRRQS